MNHRPKENQEKESLIDNLKNETFCKIGVSKISGVGVIAVKDIPKGVEIFKCCNNDETDLPIEINTNDLKEVDKNVIEHAKNFLIPSGPSTYPFPRKGLNSINIIFYLNHSDRPNTEFSLTGDLDDFVSFVTSRGIEKGEELTQDYNNLSNDEEKLTKQFPFLNNKK
jgi:SET domain-containing protein